MYSSSVSPASSSDLYSASEPVETAAQLQPPGWSKSSTGNGPHPPLEDRSFGSEGRTSPLSRTSTSSQSLQGLRDGPIDGIKGFGPPSPLPVNFGTNGTAPGLNQKRKRKTEEEVLDQEKGQSLSQDETRNLLTTGGTDGSGNGNREHTRICTDGSKRLKADGDTTENVPWLGHGEGSTAIAYLASRPPVLPAELWQHVFCFVPPVFLGRLLRVNRAFNTYLNPGKIDETVPKQPLHGVVRPLNAQLIWTASRRRFCPGLPKPIFGLQELDMWRLLRGQRCQICGKTSITSTDTIRESPWESGPGENGVRVTWPFGEVTLHLSSFPSFLLPALPFAFLSHSNHFIPTTALRNGTPPSSLQWAKCYFKPHIEDIKRRLDEARELGSASAEEWIKGLDREGKERLNDVLRWEMWEAKGGLKKVNSRPHNRKTITTGIQINTVVPMSENHSDRSTPQGLPFSTKADANGGYGSPAPTASLNTPSFSQSSASYSSSWPATAPLQDGLPQRYHNSFPQPPRPERSIRDVNEAKAARRAEIERRSAVLDPPLHPEVLNHMESFQAAIQITAPLTDHAWEVLKPRLLAQREYAKRREMEQAQHSLLVQAKYNQQRQQEAQLKQAKETLDREWDNAQAPVRNHLSKLADQITEDMWSGGKSVTKDTSPKYAADVLLYVRQQFYAEIAEEDEGARAAGNVVKADSHNEPPTRKLILENMKWVFDTKIKPMTEHFQKELFLCNGCEGNFKFYGFEGVVQHYAAKHTTTLSMGSVVVHWRAEWPEHPPFHPNPSTAKAAYYAIPTPVSTSIPMQSARAPIGYTGYADFGSRIPSQAYGVTQFSPGPYRASYPGQFQDGPYPPPPPQHYYPLPSGSSGHVQVIPPTSKYEMDLSRSQNSYHGSGGYNSFSSMIHGQNQQGYDSPFQHYNHPVPLHEHEKFKPKRLGPEAHEQRHEPGSSTPHPITLPPKPPQSYPGPQEPGRLVSGHSSDLYQLQMDEMARHAREIWFATSGIKDLPGSVRISIVIHHVVARFVAKYTNEPSLAMFIDGIEHNPLMRPVRSLNGLACKTCVTNGNGPGVMHHSHPQFSLAERRLYTLPHLLSHFKQVHLERPTSSYIPQAGLETPRPNWKLDMVELPDSALIADLIKAPGMDDAKLKLIAWVFPQAFPSPLPRVGTAGNAGPVPIYREEYNNGSRVGPLAQTGQVPVSTLTVSSSKFEGQNDYRSDSRPQSALRSSSEAARLSEPPGEDEYDPHRPAYLGRIVRSEMTSSQSRKQSRDAQVSNGKRTPTRARQNYYEYLASGGPGTALSRRNVLEDHFDTPLQHSKSSPPPRNSTTSRVEGRFENNYLDPLEQEARTGAKRNDKGLEHGAEPRHISEDGEVNEDLAAKKVGVGKPSLREDLSAVDQFLNGFKLRSDSKEYDREVVRPEYGSDDAPPSYWVNDREDRRRPKRVDEAPNTSSLRNDLQGRNGQESNLYPSTVLIGPSESSDSHRVTPLQGSTSHVQFGEEYRPSSQVQRPYSDTGMNGRLSANQAIRGNIMPPLIYDRYGIDEDESQSGYSRLEIPRALKYRSRSRSPELAPVESTYTRARSPIPNHRQETIYRVRSPSLHDHTRPRRVVGYEYEPNDYQYIEDREYPEKQYRQRVEYIPVRVGDHRPVESSRYVVAQPISQRAPVDYLPFERGFDGEQVFSYERNGQVYHAGPRTHPPRQSRGPPSSVQDYGY